jgi:hypothetical protein
VNEIIARLIEGGIPTYLTQFIPETKSFLKAKPVASNSLLDEYSALNMNNLQPAFYLLLFGHFLGLISFLLEVLYFKIYPQRH